MSGKIFKVVAAPGDKSPKEFKAALAEAKESDVLAVPGDALLLTVNSGSEIEVDHERK